MTLQTASSHTAVLAGVAGAALAMGRGLYRQQESAVCGTPATAPPAMGEGGGSSSGGNSRDGGYLASSAGAGLDGLRTGFIFWAFSLLRGAPRPRRLAGLAVGAVDRVKKGQNTRNRSVLKQCLRNNSNLNGSFPFSSFATVSSLSLSSLSHS